MLDDKTFLTSVGALEAAADRLGQQTVTIQTDHLRRLLEMAERPPRTPADAWRDEDAVVATLRQMSMAEQLDAATTVGARMRFARGHAGLTLGQMARLLDRTVVEISAAERGDGGGLVALYADYCGVTLRWLETGLRQNIPVPLGSPEEVRLIASICGHF